jgi:ATP-binding cassette subfamily B protein/subfamily B ATP-binding cassette protein MsbA
VKREYWKYMATIVPYLKRHKLLASASLFLMAAGALAALAQPWPLAFVVDSVLGHQTPPQTITHLVGRSPNSLIVFAVSVSIGIVLFNSVVGVIDSYVNTRLEQRMALEFRSDLFAHCVRLSQAFHDYRNLGDFIYRINFEAHHVGAVTVAIPALIQSALTLVAMFVITYAISPTLALLALSVVPFVYLSIGIYGKHIEPRLIRVRGLEGLSLSIVHEVFSRLKVVVGFNREEHEGERFWRQGDDAVRARIGVTVAQTVFNLAVGLITAIGTGLILGIGAHYVLDKTLSLGQLLVVIAYVGSIYQPLQTISSTMGEFQNHLVALRFAGEIMRLVPDVEDQPDAHELRDVRGAVAMEGLCFDYRTRQGTLKDITFSVEPGQVVAIVGPTGAGKSTLVNLLMRFYDPTAGRVLVDGHDIRTVTQRSLRQHIGLVLQEPLLLGGTVADNIRYGKLNATDDEVVEAAKAANAHDFIARLPSGYDTELGEGGARLSGGERQRICIARAFVKAAPILILDEPTSSIDSRTEAVILDALDRLMVGRTTFMIAHRLSTVRHADQILVVNDGELVEHGTHEELMEQHGLYHSLSEMQSGERRAPKAAPEPPREVQPEVQSQAQSALAPSDDELTWTGSGLATRPKVVVLGMMTKIPVAGVVWQTMHYLVGLERLGFDAYYVEAHARTPSMFVHAPHEDVADTAAAFIAATMRRFGLEQRWAFHALHDGDRCYGMTRTQLQQLYRSAALIINLHGGTRPLEEHTAAGTLIFIETDPVALQVELDQGREDTIQMLEQHAAFFTFAENLGHPSCGLPVTDRFAFRPTRQPVLLDRWDGSHGPAERFTTIGNWRQSQREVHFRDETYLWSKDLEFRKVLGLPGRSDQRFELALASFTEADELLLRENGWFVRPASELSDDIERYRAYIEGSRGEFTVAKDQNVRLRSGWFSDRSATYLAAGRPVVTQETGFSNVLPTGQGLLAFATLDEAAAAIETINADYGRHQAAAREIARECFAHDRVLKPILEHVGLSPAGRRYGLLPAESALPDDLILTPTSKRPLCLEPATVEAVGARPHPTPRHRAAVALGPRCAASVVVVTFGDLALVRMSIESILANTQFTRFEIIVIDNGSSPETVSYLQDVAKQFTRVQLVLNPRNEGFPAAVNRGLQLATGRVLVVLNDDVIVTPHWLVGLIRHLDDAGVGLVGPATNAAPNEARVPATYRTYGELIDFAAERRHRLGGQAFEIGVATMFCVAMRRDVFERVGLLDEDFGIGQFEDDDYAMRVRRAGYRVVCAEDVFVHHFGEASFGRLASSGEYAQQIQRNRRLFETKWGVEWAPHEHRPTQDYEHLKDAIKRYARERDLPWADVLVVTNGDADLLDLDGVNAGHFPQGPGGQYTGHHPANGDDAVRQLDELHARGARFLVFPRTTAWWLEHFAALLEHLETHATELAGVDECRVFELAPTTLETPAPSRVGTRSS